MNTQTVKETTATAPVNGNGNHSAIDLIDADIVIARAQAIIDDTSGKYLTDTQDALRYHFEHASDVSIILAITERAERGEDSPLDLGARANRIIYDAESYDRETRDAVQRTLEAAIKGDSDLDELIDVLQTCEAKPKRQAPRRPFVEPQITPLAGSAQPLDVDQLYLRIAFEVDKARSAFYDRLRAGEHPHDAYLDFMSAITMDIPNEYIPDKETGVALKPARRTVLARAQAILDDADSYDEATRGAIQSAIDRGHGHEDINALCERAEAGESLVSDSLFNLVGVRALTNEELSETPTNELWKLAAERGVDTSKNWSRHELIQRIGFADKWITVADPDLRNRALALLIPDSETDLPRGGRWHLEFALECNKWEMAAALCERIEAGTDIDDVLIEHDERNLPDEEIDAVIEALAGNLDDEHSAGYFFIALDYMQAHARSPMGAECAAADLKRLFLAHNSHSSDVAITQLTAASLAKVRAEFTDNEGSAADEKDN